MNGARMTLWIILGLAELLIISLALNIFSLRWRRRAMRESIPHPPLQLGEAIAQKAQEIEDVYRRIIGEGDEDVWSLLKNVQAKEKELEELFQAPLAWHETVRNTPYGMLLRSLGDRVRDSHELVTTAMKQRFERTRLLQELRERMLTQERLLQELKELIIMFQGELEALLQGPQEGPPNAEALAHLQQRYQLAQEKLQEFELKHQALLPKDESSRNLFDVLTTLFDTLSTLKEEKARLEGEVERLKGLEEANLKVQHDARRLEDQLSRSQDLVQQLRTKYEHLSKQYMRAFGPHNS